MGSAPIEGFPPGSHQALNIALGLTMGCFPLLLSRRRWASEAMLHMSGWAILAIICAGIGYEWPKALTQTQQQAALLMASGAWTIMLAMRLERSR